MRIVHISDSFAPFVGGIETQLGDLARDQSRRGHEVHVITATAAADGALSAIRWEDGVRVHRHAARMPGGIPVNPRESGLIRESLIRLRPDVVHVHAGMVSPFAFDGVRQALAGHVPTVVTWHCLLRGVRTTFGSAARALGWTTAPFLATAVSTVAARDVGALLNRDVVPLIPNGVDVDAWRPDAVRVLEPGRLRVVATMRLAPRKRVVPLLAMMDRAYGLLQAAGVELSVSLIGTGPFEGFARSAATSALPWLTVEGRVPREELRARYRDADVFVAPAELEAFGIAALEARAAGLAVLGRAGTGAADFVVDGVDGLLAESDGALVRQLVLWGCQDRPALEGVLAHNGSVPPSFSRADVIASCDAAYATVI